MKTRYIKSKYYACSISQLPILFFLFVMAYCPLWGQDGQQQKIIQPKDYAMWHKMRFPLISGDGKWTSYLLDYEQLQDTLVVMNIDEMSKYEFSNARGGQFAPCKSPKLFAFNDDANGVGVLNLIEGKTTWVKEAQYYKFSTDGKYLACYNINSQIGYLKLFDIDNNKTTIIEGVQSFEFNPSSKEVVLITKETNTTKVEILYLSQMRRSSVLSKEKSEFINPTWNETGEGLIFMEDDNLKRRIYYFENRQTPILKELDNIDLKKLGYVELSTKTLSFSEDGERVFFYTHNKKDKPKEEDLDTVKVQVWKGKDKLVYPRAKLYKEFEIKDKMAVWWPKTGKLFQIGTSERPKIILNGDQKFALSYDPIIYEPQFKESPQSDFYITNLETEESKVFLRKMETGPEYLSMSPNGESIAYFNDNNWWIYNILNDEHFNCTSNLDLNLTFKFAPSTARITPYGYMGWTTHNEFLIYDEFDVWKISPTDQTPISLTKGRNDKTSYRKYYDLHYGFYPIGKSVKDIGFDLSEDIILSTQDSLFNCGFAIKERNKAVRPLFNEQGRINGLRKAKFNDSYVFTLEKYNSPPALYLLDGKKSKILVQSNSHQERFKIGKTELISFKNKEGENLHGLLHYPDNYVAGKQYPMVVKIYEMISDHYNFYTNPGKYSEIGFNYRNFTASGYFVLEPDVRIQMRNPGISATNCVVASVNKVLEKGMVKKNAIGLIGHSFGGYETAFIITQTDLFAAAVMGAGIFDIVTSAHRINQETGEVGFGDIEDSQWKMEKSFYEDKENYRRNSPIEHVNKGSTPTLIWTGNKDFHVGWQQSLEMYMSLRRLGAEVELLVYENEIHVLTKKKNQSDLTERIEKWFSKYLKKE